MKIIKNIGSWFKDNRDTVVRNTFLIPILLVVIISISHVVSWYDLGNPISWAIYLSIAIEIFALASVSAASIKVNRASIWFLFGLVTAIQIIGNVFFEYQDINMNDPAYLSWVELISPAFTDWDVTDHRRLLALVQGGTLPLMSLTALHYYIKFTDKKNEEVKPISESIPSESELDESVKRYVKPVPEPIDAVQVLEDTLIEELAKAESTSNELEKVETELEEIREDVEPIDEDAILNEDITDKDIVPIESAEDSKLSETLDTLDKLENTEGDVPESLNDSDADDEEDNFGPPQINNGQI